MELSEFWSIDAHKRKAREALERQMERAKSTRALALRISAIQSHPAFQQYMQSIKDLREARLKSLIHSEDKFETARLQGYVRSYDDILKAMSSAEKVAGDLAKTIENLQNKLNPDQEE